VIVLYFLAYLVGYLYNLYVTIVFSLGIIFGAGVYHILRNKVIPYSRLYKGYIQGAKGETSVTDFLINELEPVNLIVSDLTFGKNHANIDHLVICKNGIFVVETKTHKGIVRCYGDKWFHLRDVGGSPISKNIKWSPSNQARWNAVQIREFFVDKYPDLSKVFIQAIVVFPNDETKVEIVKKPENCFIASSLNELLGYMANNELKGDINISTSSMEELYELFSKYATKVDLSR